MSSVNTPIIKKTKNSWFDNKQNQQHFLLSVRSGMPVYRILWGFDMLSNAFNKYKKSANPDKAFIQAVDDARKISSVDRQKSYQKERVEMLLNLVQVTEEKIRKNKKENLQLSDVKEYIYLTAFLFKLLHSFIERNVAGTDELTTEQRLRKAIKDDPEYKDLEWD